MNFCIILVMCTVRFGNSLKRVEELEKQSIPGSNHHPLDSGLLVIKGEKAPQHAYPFQASLQQLVSGKGWQHRCAGVIVGQVKILTTAYCVQKFFNGNLSEYRAVAGINNIQDYEAVPQVRTFVDGYMHPKYSQSIHDDDYFVAYVNHSFTFDDGAALVRPIELPNANFEATGVCTAAGWGHTDEGEYSPDLHHVNLTVVQHPTCEDLYNGIGQSVTPRMICAGQDGRGICDGDFGGPLLCNQVLAGISSWIAVAGDCTRSDYPSVFANVAMAIEWINSV